MVDALTTRLWAYRALFVVLAFTLLFFRVLPLDLAAGRWPGPDFLLCLTFAWVLRRPNYVPTLLVAALFLMNDMFFMRPPGLWTALVVVGLEFLRSREQFSRDLPFMIEWAMVSAVLVAMTLVNRIILAIFVVDQPIFGLVAIGLFGNILAYPLVVAFSRLAFGVRKIAPGEVDQLGHPI